MSLSVFVIECVIFMAVFGALVFGMLLVSPLTFVSDYPPEIQERYYISQRKEKSRRKMTAAMAVKKGIGFHVKVMLPLLPVFAAGGLLIAGIMVWIW